MSSLSSDINIIATVFQYVNYIYIIVLIAAVIGNILNSLIVSNLKLFRRNQCALYLNAESVINIAVFVYTFIDRITHYPNSSDLADYSLAWCRIRFFLDQITQLIPFSIICFAAFDQILSTSHWYTLRQMSTFKLAKHLIIAAIFLAVIHSIPAMFWFNLFPPIGCTTKNSSITYYYLFFYYPVLVGILPIFISSLFSLVAFRNVRHVIRRQIPIVRRRLDQQLTAMVFIRVIIFVILYTPYVIYRIYTLYLLANSEYNIPFLLDQLIQTSVILLKDINYGIIFYVFLISSSRFRRQVKWFLGRKCLNKLKNWSHSNRNQIHPVRDISTAPT